VGLSTVRAVSASSQVVSSVSAVSASSQVVSSVSAVSAVSASSQVASSVSASSQVASSVSGFTTGSCFNCLPGDNPNYWLLHLGNDYVTNGCDNCSILNNRAILLTWLPAGVQNHGTEISNGCYWQSDIIGNVCISGGLSGPAFFQLRALPGITVTWELQLKVGPSDICTWDGINFADWNCITSNTFVNPTWSPDTCTSSSSVVVTPVC
jgi:hypothetical protein